MITDEERAEHFKLCRARWAEPDPSIRMDAGRAWVRDQPKQCPHCDSIFYTLRPAHTAPVPCRVDPLPEPWDRCQARETCGSPRCHEEEIMLHLRRSWAQAAAKEKASAPAKGEAQPGPKTKLRKKGQQGGQPQNLIPLKDLSHGE